MDNDGLWVVCRMRATMFQGLQLGPAMKLAREAAREEHLRVGEPTFVDLAGAVLGGAIDSGSAGQLLTHTKIGAPLIIAGKLGR